MNGGVLDAIESLSPDELAAAQAAYSHFGLAFVTTLIGAAREAIHQDQDLDILEPKLDQDYWAVIPDDGTLVNAFTAHFNGNAGEYSPLVGN